MSRICLDTSTYGHFKRAVPEVVEILNSSREVCVPAITIGELRTGFRLGSRERQNETELRAFLSNPVVRVLVVDDEAATHYAALMVDLRREATPLPTNDVWIGALAVREGATVITYDEHFTRMRRVGSVILGRK